ncbi:MAG TPA: SDR family oxidoreductase [Gammaproteobacteria bacterium]
MTRTDVPAILITGATGNVGRQLVKQLSAREVPYRAMLRSSKDAEAFSTLEGAEVVIGDFDKPETLVHALQGVERAFLLTNSSERAEGQQSNFVDLARRHGVRHIVKLSQWSASLDSPVRFLRYHATIERKIRESAIAYTFLRPNLFMQGLLAFRETIIGQGRFFAAAGDARISAIDVRDIASAAAAALVDEEGHEGQIYNLTGPEALSHREMAEKLSAALGRQIDFVDVPPDAMRKALIEAGVSVWQADGLIEDYAHYSRGEAAEVTTGVHDATGGLPRTFDNFASDYADAFSRG